MAHRVAVYMRMACNLGFAPRSLHVPFIVLYSLGVISSRAHYTVDVVLAWWALLVAQFLLEPRRGGQEKRA